MNLNPFGSSLTEFLDDIGFRNSFNPFENLQGPLNDLGFSNTNAVREGQQSIDDALEMAQGNYGQNEADLQAYYDALSKKYGGDEQAYRDAIDAYLNGDVAQVEDFSYDRDVNEFMDPAAEMRKQNAMTAINNSASAEGSRFSSDFLNRQAAKQQAMASEEWQKAYERFQQDRQAQLQQWQANAGNVRSNQAAQDEKLKAAMDIYGGNSGKMDEAFADFISGMIGNRNAGTQTEMDAVSGKTDLGMNAERGVGGLFKTIGKIFG